MRCERAGETDYELPAWLEDWNGMCTEDPSCHYPWHRRNPSIPYLEPSPPRP